MKDRELTRPHAVWILIIAALLVPACTRASSNEENESRLAKVEPIEGSTVNRVTLTPAAAERLDIRTATVVETRVAGNRTRREVIPYAAVLYDPNAPSPSSSFDNVSASTTSKEMWPCFRTALPLVLRW